LLTRIINDTLGYKVIGDLPFPSSISATKLRLVPFEKQSLRFSNYLINPESNPRYNLVNLLMASTAIPVIFPTVKIRDADNFPQIRFMDGGIGDDHIPYEAVIQYLKYRKLDLDTLIIVSRKTDSELNIRDELYALGLRDTKLFEKMGVSVQRYSKGSFLSKLEELQMLEPALAARTYVYVPDFEQDFPLLNFNTMNDQYEATSEWARHNKPLLLSEYLRRNSLKHR
jgi:predicted acylesterase/phospholipase RssA